MHVRMNMVIGDPGPGRRRHPLPRTHSAPTRGGTTQLPGSVGHGQYDNDDRLCLSLADSSPDAIFRTTTSLTLDAVRLAFRSSKATTKIAILDCCFAGLAAGREGTLAAGLGICRALRAST
jgi:uncharacterized caspase-like protein